MNSSLSRISPPFRARFPGWGPCSDAESPPPWGFPLRIGGQHHLPSSYRAIAQPADLAGRRSGPPVGPAGSPPVMLDREFPSREGNIAAAGGNLGGVDRLLPSGMRPWPMPSRMRSRCSLFGVHPPRKWVSMPAGPDRIIDAGCPLSATSIARAAREVDPPAPLGGAVKARPP